MWLSGLVGVETFFNPEGRRISPGREPVCIQRKQFILKWPSARPWTASCSPTVNPTDETANKQTKQWTTMILGWTLFEKLNQSRSSIYGVLWQNQVVSFYWTNKKMDTCVINRKMAATMFWFQKPVFVLLLCNCMYACVLLHVLWLFIMVIMNFFSTSPTQK